MNDNRISEDVMPLLEKMKGVEWTYKELCQELGLKYQKGNGKISQFKDLDMYCQIDKVPNSNKYIISEVYDEATIRELNGNDKYQAVFESAIYHMFLDNGDKPLYVSYMEILRMFNEVNYNFPILCSNAATNNLGKEYSVLSDISQPTYKILREWTRRKIDKMNARGIALKRDGFRLYKHYEDYIMTHNVPIGTEEEAECQVVWNKAVNAVMPQGWSGGWVSSETWEVFEGCVSRYTVEQFKGEYDDLKRIVILSSPTQSYVKEMLEKLYNDYPNLKKINDEVYYKIISSQDKRLLPYSEDDKIRFADIAIKQHPIVNIKNKNNNTKE